MTLDRHAPALIETVARRVIAHADELTALDQAIGDGDHGLNMKRGFEAVLAELDGHAAKPLPEALKAIGMTLVMKVGGASGPLYGTLFMTLGKELPAEPSRADLGRGVRRRDRGGQGARQVRCRPEDHARRAGAGARRARRRQRDPARRRRRGGARRRCR